MPPSDAFAPGSIGKNSPVSRISALSCSRVTPACTVTVRSSGLTRTTAVMRETSMLTPPCTASRWPSSDEPMPNGMTGTACASASLTTAATSSVLSQNTTTSGGVTGNGDSSRPCCSRIGLDVEQRSSKRACSAASIAPGTGRIATAGRAIADRGAFIVGLQSPPRRRAPVLQPNSHHDRIDPALPPSAGHAGHSG